MKNKFLIIAGVVLLACSVSELRAADCQPVSATYLQNGLDGMTADDIWTWDSYGYAKARKQGGGEGNLFTPELNLAGTDGITIQFTHAHNYAENPSADYTLWVTDDYKGSYASTTWKQLIISPYSSNTNWNFVEVSLDVPVSYVGEKTVFCFKYTSTAEKNGTWEIKNLRVTGTCAGKTAPPVNLPDLGDGQLKVCAQNLLNYYFNYNTGRGDYTREEFAEKTRKITDAILWIDADVYGFCELEAQDIILRQLVDSLNKRTLSAVYSYVEDDIDEPWDATYDNNLKSGFIFRNDKVKTVGPNLPAYNSNYYGNTMRIQTFEELSSGERFTMSMNHFKSKAGNASDQGNSTRVTNATRLIENLPSKALDKDILIMGDLNCEVGEDPLNIIEDAGYAEQLLKYDASAFSHCYNGGELIDHAYANASMAAQITGAGVFHISTGCGSDASANYGHRYSDHDPYIVAINLSSEHPATCEPKKVSYLPTGGSGLGEMKTFSVSGQYNWQYDSNYGAKCSERGGEDWLFTPSYDLSQAVAVTLSFEHTINYANNMTDEQTLWVTNDFVSVSESEWQQINIPTYPTGKNWTFVSNTVDVPLNLVGANTSFAFRYKVPSDAANKPTWEIKNLKLTVSCSDAPDAIVTPVTDQHAVRKMLQDGRLIIVQPDGTRYSVMGLIVR